MAGNVIQFVGYSNSGKTTLMSKLIELLTVQHYKIGTIKHHPHTLPNDQEGKDTWIHRVAGAKKTFLASNQMTTLYHIEPPSLEMMVALQKDMDFIFIEGFKHAFYQKVLLIRVLEEMHLLHDLENIVALVVWPSVKERVHKEVASLPMYDVNDIRGISQFVCEMTR